MKIHKIELTEDLGDGDKWGVWKCEVECADGSIREGYVQGDEHSTAEETLEDEYGEPFKDTSMDGPTHAQLESARESAHHADERYRKQMIDAGRRHLLLP